jgi:hypothetical protein
LPRARSPLPIALAAAIAGAAITAIVLVLVLGGGGHHRSPPKRTATEVAVTAEGAAGSVSAPVGSAVPLGLTRSQLISRIGRPAGALGRQAGGFHCLLYRMTGEPPAVELQYCFLHDRLKFLSTYVDEGLGIASG